MLDQVGTRPLAWLLLRLLISETTRRLSHRHALTLDVRTTVVYSRLLIVHAPLPVCQQVSMVMCHAACAHQGLADSSKVSPA
jgi:hypothetical protein